MVSFTTPTSGNFNQQAFMQSRPDIANAGLDFNTWYNAYGKNEAVDQFSPYIQSGGVTPMTVEPLTDFEKQGYLQAASQVERPEVQQVSNYLQGVMNTPQVSGQAMGYMGDAASFLRQGAAPITFNEVQDFRNPYSQALQDNLTEEGRKAQAAIIARQGSRGGASFGNAMMGTQRGELDAGLARGRTNIEYQTYNDAMANLLKQRALQQSAGGSFGNLGTATQGIQSAGTATGMNAASNLFDLASGATDMARTRTSDLLGAGRDIRGYNQAILDMVSKDILGQQNYEPQQIATLQSLLDAYKSNTSSGGVPAQNGLQTAGGIGTLVGGWLGNESLQKPSAAQQSFEDQLGGYL